MKSKTALTLSLILVLFVSVFEVALTSAESPPSINIEKWTFTTGETAVYSTFVQDAYVFASAGYSGSSVKTLYCLNAETGKQLWNHSSDILSYTVANGRVYVGETSRMFSGHSQGFLRCLNVSNGAEFWSNNLTGGVGKPIIIGSSVFVTAVAYQYFTDTSASKIFAFDLMTGHQKWSYTAPIGLRFNSMFIHGDYAYLINNQYWDNNNSYTSSIYALNILNGQKVWSYSSVGYFKSLNVTDGKVIASLNADAGINVGPASLIALDAQYGTLLWTYLTPQAISSLYNSDNAVYCATSFGNISAIDASTGQGIWNYADNSLMGSLFLVDGYLYASTALGVSCFNPQDGAKIWSYQASDYDVFYDLSPTYPVFFNGTVWFGWNGPQGFVNTNHNFYALNARTGEVVWKYNLSYSVMNTPVIANNTLYIGGSGVTTRSMTWVGPGAVIALNPSPKLVISSSSLPVAMILIIIVVTTVAIVTAFLIHKRKITKGV